MPQARSAKPRSRSRFKEPAALKRLNRSLDTAQKALTELGKGSSRGVGKGAGDLYKDLRTFVSNARRDSGKLAKTLQREFDQAQKELAKAASSARSSSGRSSSSRSTSKRSSSSRSSSSRSGSARSSGTRASTRRSSSRGGSRKKS